MCVTLKFISKREFGNEKYIYGHTKRQSTNQTNELKWLTSSTKVWFLSGTNLVESLLISWSDTRLPWPLYHEN